MKHCFASSPHAATLSLVAVLCACAPQLTLPVQAAPKLKLEIWPERRVLMVLPLQLSPTWNADPQLGQAILPLAQPQMQQAMNNTGKFSVTLPYRFDPVLRRGLSEKQLAENDIKSLLEAPTLANAGPIIDKLNFAQPVMATEVVLEELTIGGDSKKPTVQLQVSGKLYQQGDTNAEGKRDLVLVKTETYRSAPIGGKTPSDRLVGAAKNAFDGLAAAFVEPPAAFDLPAPIEIAPPAAADPKSKGKAAAPGAAPTPATPGAAVGATPGATTTPTMPMEPPAPLPSVATPNILPGSANAPLVPQLPAAEPPLGVTAGEGTTAGR